MKGKENGAYGGQSSRTGGSRYVSKLKKYVKRDLGFCSGLFKSSSLHNFCLRATNNHRYIMISVMVPCYNTLGIPENLLQMGLVFVRCGKI